MQWRVVHGVCVCAMAVSVEQVCVLWWVVCGADLCTMFHGVYNLGFPRSV